MKFSSGFDGWVALRDKLDDPYPNTFVRPQQIDIVVVKAKEKDSVQVRLYLEHGQEVEGWLSETQIALEE